MTCDVLQIDALPPLPPGSPAGSDRPPFQLEKKGVTPHPDKGNPTKSGVALQRVFALDKQVLRDSLTAKLRSVGQATLAGKLELCQTKKTVRRCSGCKTASVFWNRCDNRLCPICQPRLAHQRQEELRWWCSQISQPKHVVLTVRNTERITRDRVQAVKKSFEKLRRLKFARGWKGGFYSLEVTNEGRGWHLHIHALIDARYIDSAQLAINWARLVNQDYSIVKVKDARQADYLREVAKYAVKGTDLATWSGDTLLEFVQAFEGVRTFATFGTLFKRREGFRAWRDEYLAERGKCKCGCAHFEYFNENEWEWEECCAGPNGPPEIPVIEAPRQAYLDIGAVEFDFRGAIKR